MRFRWTMHVCRLPVANSHVVSDRIRESLQPVAHYDAQVLNAAILDLLSTPSQNSASSPPSLAQMPRISYSPAVVTPIAT